MFVTAHSLLLSVLRNPVSKSRGCRRSISAWMLICLVSMAGTSSAAGTWKKLTNPNPQFACGTMLLLTDGTVMVEGYDSQTWSKLTPDSTGSYTNGTWTTLGKMSTPRLYFASRVLPDGRVFVLGGEYSGSFLSQNFSNTGEIYDPVKNKWSPIARFPRTQFGDDPSMLLPDGTVMVGYISGPQTYIYDPNFDFWFTGSTKLRNDQSDEEIFLQLPGWKFVSYDVFASDKLKAGHAQYYDYFSDQWFDAGSVPVIMSSTTQGFELGPGGYLPNGKAIIIGANEKSAIYTPPASTGATGSWVAGPTLPTGMGADDAPGAVLPNGHFVFLADFYLFNSPVSMFDYDYNTNTLTDITATLPTELQAEMSFTGAYEWRMLVLPNGNLLLGNDQFDTPWEYTPGGGALANWRPTISGIANVSKNRYRITGARLTGISEGATYGDDAEMSTNYPIVRMDQVGVQKYARSYSWTPGISNPGDTTLNTVDFDVPAGTPPGTYQVSVIANGIQSLSVPLTIPANQVTASFSNGTLNINGDDQPNSITMTYKQVKVSGVLKSASVTIAASDASTKINGQTSVTFDVGINRFNVNANMAGGDDSITFNSFFSSTILLNLGAGNDTASFLFNSISTALSVDGGTGTDTVTYSGNSITKTTTTNVP
mgnify:FL=1